MFIMFYCFRIDDSASATRVVFATAGAYWICVVRSLSRSKGGVARTTRMLRQGARFGRRQDARAPSSVPLAAAARTTRASRLISVQCRDACSDRRFLRSPTELLRHSSLRTQSRRVHARICNTVDPLR